MRTIPDPGFTNDDGAASAEVTAALAAYEREPGRLVEALAVLQDARLLVPVVALLGEVQHDERGLAHDKADKQSDMATVLMQGSDGRQALLAFTGQEGLTRWNPAARPVPVTVQTAAKAAVQDGAAALLVDVAGPVPLVVEGAVLESWAAGERLLRVEGGWAWVRLEDPDTRAGR